MLGSKLVPPAGCCYCLSSLEEHVTLDRLEEDNSQEGLPQIGTVWRPLRRDWPRNELVLETLGACRGKYDPAAVSMIRNGSEAHGGAR